MFVSITLSAVNSDNETIKRLVKRTHYELLETQLNVWHLILLKQSGLNINSNEYARIEMDFAEYVSRDDVLSAAVIKLLPSIDQLYFVISNRQISFHPFATIKAYHILSILLETPVTFESLAELRQTTIAEQFSLMLEASSDIVSDDVSNAIWKFINAHLRCKHIYLDSVNGDVMKRVLTHVRNICQSYKSNELR